MSKLAERTKFLGSLLKMGDPLSPVTRRERQFLLLVSLMGLAVAKGGLIPEKITALGIDLSATQQKNLLFLISLAMIYFLVAFLLYGFSDYTALQGRRRQLDMERLDVLTSLRTTSSEGTGESQSITTRRKELEEDSTILEQVQFSEKYIRLHWLRVFFEFAIPLFFGVISLGLVVNAMQGFRFLEPFFLWLAEHVKIYMAIGVIAIVGIPATLLFLGRRELRRLWKNGRAALRSHRRKRLLKRARQSGQGSKEWKAFQDLVESEFRRFTGKSFRNSRGDEGREGQDRDAT